MCGVRGQLQVKVKDNVASAKRPKMGVAQIEEADTGRGWAM